ncbi:MAG: MerR family transcriptional regulator [Candidatus Eremiobacteraeota bacterium]|nr:MerR family transcriptional regulator [Candidatus Eremiobacteraeota bacterium]
MLDLHPQTIRNYERKGLLKPARTEGRMRLFSRHDINRVKKISTYTDMGVNLAGVEIILKLLNRIDSLEEEMEKEMNRMQLEMEARMRESYKRMDNPSED